MRVSLSDWMVIVDALVGSTNLYDNTGLFNYVLETRKFVLNNLLNEMQKCGLVVEIYDHTKGDGNASAQMAMDGPYRRGSHE